MSVLKIRNPETGEWEVVSGGGTGGGLGNLANVRLANGVFDLSAYTAKTPIETGITIGMLRGYKLVRIYIKSGSADVSGLNIILGTTTENWPIVLDGLPTKYYALDLEWADDSRTLLKKTQVKDSSAYMWNVNTWSSALGGWNGSIEWCKASNPSGTFLDTSKMNSASQLFFRFTSDKANETQDCEWYIQGVLA